MSKTKCKVLSIFLSVLLVFTCVPAFTLPVKVVKAESVMVGGISAHITKSGNTWTLENDILKTVISFADGSIDMKSFYNKIADVEYLTGSGPRELFSYELDDGSIASANNGKWTLIKDEISDIELYDRKWGKQVAITIACTDPVNIQVKLVFEIYNGDAGLRYQCYIKNNTAQELKIAKSNVIELNFPNNPHMAYYVPNMKWTSTTGELNGTRNAIMVYNSGDGWCISPEINWKTDGSTDSKKPPFGAIYAWVGGEKSVRFSTIPASLQLVLFPGEEIEYLAVNLTVFKGDSMDGRANVERHFKLRYKYWDPTTIVSFNDWEWYSSGKRNDNYYRTVVVPKALAGGIDRINVDDRWNGYGDTYDKDSPYPLTSFTTDLPSLADYIVSKGLRIGYWFSLSAGTRDIADWNNVQLKIDQLENILIAQYHSNWDQIDLQQLNQNPNITSYSHPSDSVYRKAVNLRKFQEYFTHKYPTFSMKPTNEVDLGLQGDTVNNERRNNGLIHLADNGLLCPLGEYNDGDIGIPFSAFGYFPMNSVFMYYDSNTWYKSAEWLYQFLTSRESVLYKVPDSMDDETLAYIKEFNTWRKNPRIKELLNDVFLPVKTDDVWSWMYTNKDKSQAILFATGAYKSSINQFKAYLRWLDDDKTYLVMDITYNDDGSYNYEFIERSTGEKLKTEGLTVDFTTNTSKAKAYWIQEDNGAPMQVLYADHSVNSYIENYNDYILTVNVTDGIADSTAKIAVYKRESNSIEIKDCKLNPDGTGSVSFTVDEAIDDSNLIKNPGFESGIDNWTFIDGGVDSSNPKSGRYAAYLNAAGNSGPDGGFGPPPGFGGSLVGTSKVSQTLIVPVTGSYKLSGWFYVESTGKMGIKVNGTDLDSVTMSSASKYTEYSISGLSLKKGDEVEIYVNGASNSGKVYIDNMSLVNESPALTNLVLNSGFDDDDTSKYWTMSSGASIVTDIVSSVPNAVYLDADARVSQLVTVPLNGYYKLTVKGYLGNGTGTMGVETVTGAVYEKAMTNSGGNGGFGPPPDGFGPPPGFGGIRYSTYTLSDILLNAYDSVTVYVYGSGIRVDDFSLTFDTSKVPSCTVSVENVGIAGKVQVGEQIMGKYDFIDSLGHNEYKSTYRWLIGDTKGGIYTPLNGETAITYKPTLGQVGKFIKFEVTPQDCYGRTGTAVQSDPVQIGLNLIKNSDFESGTSYWSFDGSNIQNATDDIKPISGDMQACIEAGTDNRIAQIVDVQKSGVYELSAYTVAEEGETKGSIGIRRTNGDIIATATIPFSDSYSQISISGLMLEANDQVEVFINGGDGKIYVDDIELLIDNSKSTPMFKNIRTFAVTNQIGSSIISQTNHTVAFTMPYGADITSLAPVITVSDGAKIIPESGQLQDFSKPITYTVIGKDNTSQTWTVICRTATRPITIDSSNNKIKEAFNWAIPMALSYVQTGKTGVLNKDERNTATSIGEYIPSYWAGYSYRSAYYIRDFAHQAAGAHLLGLDLENFTMFKSFMKTSTEARKWYPVWALNFDGSIFKLDYPSDDRFVREVPAVFELVEKAYEQYLWTGNKSYINDPVLLNYYEKALTDFITLHDNYKPNGVAEGAGTGFNLYTGMATYNEVMGENLIEAGDGIACEYKAMLAYSKLLRAIGDTDKAKEYEQKAQKLKDYFNNDWGVMEGVNEYVRGYDPNGKAYKGFGKEGSVFMALKGIVEPGSKTDAFLDYIDEMEESSEGSKNIEALTYLPDTFFQYGRNETAWKWMKYIIDNRNTPHVNSLQGVNGTYPEVSYTLISQTVCGLMGIEPNAPENKVTTVSRLPKEIEWLALDSIPLGDHEIYVRHDGTTKTTLSHNKGNEPLSWEVQFYGSYPSIDVNGTILKAETKTVNGVTVSYVTTEVPVGSTVIAEALETPLQNNKNIVSVASPNGIKVYRGTEYNELDLPEKLLVTFDDDSTSLLDVIWDQGNYDGNSVGTYTLYGTLVLQDGMSNTKNIKAQITVTVYKTSSGRDSRDKTSSGTTTPTTPITQTEPSTPTTHAKKFIDTGNYQWAEEAIEALASEGIIKGTSETTFEPGKHITRADFITLLVRTLGLKADLDSNFADVSQDTYYYEAVGVAKKLGIATGVGGNMFNPTEEISRQDMMVIIARALKVVGKLTKSGIATDISSFDDASQVADYAIDSVAALIQEGIIKGIGNNVINPRGTATRAEVAVIIYRIYNKWITSSK